MNAGGAAASLLGMIGQDFLEVDLEHLLPERGCGLFRLLPEAQLPVERAGGVMTVEGRDEDHLKAVGDSVVDDLPDHARADPQASMRLLKIERAKPAGRRVLGGEEYAAYRPVRLTRLDDQELAGVLTQPFL